MDTTWNSTEREREKESEGKRAGHARANLAMPSELFYHSMPQQDSVEAEAKSMISSTHV